MSKVEWKFLNDMCCIYDGTHQTPKYTNAGVKFVSVENINAPYKSSKYISEDDYSQNYKTKPQKGDVLMTRIGDVGTCAVLDNDEPLAYYVSLALLRPNSQLILSNYVKYILESNIGKRELRKKTLLTAVPLKINLGDVGKIKLPVPSLSEQNRIVGILDTFTASIDNLKEQIAQRRKQYEYYRDQLLDLEGKEGVEMKTLGEVCIIKNGYTPSTKELSFWENGTLPWFTLEDIRKNGRILKDSIKHITSLGVKRGGLFPKDSIIISTTATIGEYALIKSDFLCNQQITCLAIKEEKKEHLLPKYLYYLSDGIGKWCKSHVNGGGSLLIVSASKLNGLQVPLPSLEEQLRIVDILDTFEESIQNLEAQLAGREKQYEYYRNKLLTFE